MTGFVCPFVVIDLFAAQIADPSGNVLITEPWAYGICVSALEVDEVALLLSLTVSQTPKELDVALEEVSSTDPSVPSICEAGTIVSLFWPVKPSIDQLFG